MPLRKLSALVIAVAFAAAACADTPSGDVAFTGDPIPQEDATPDATGDGEADDGAIDDSADAGDPPTGGDLDSADGPVDGDADNILEISLSADNVIGGGEGAASGDGFIDVAASEVCVDVTMTGLESDVTAAHIHEGDQASTGPVLVPFPAPTAGEAAGEWILEACVEIDDETRSTILDAPGALYLNVHTQNFPDGALRGQLA